MPITPYHTRLRGAPAMQVRRRFADGRVDERKRRHATTGNGSSRARKYVYFFFLPALACTVMRFERPREKK